MPLTLFRKKRETQDAAAALYEAAVAQARLPAFYAALGVPDTVDGRFDMVALHVFLLLHRLKAEGAAPSRLAQALFDTMFQDMDYSLRELGVGDLGVGRRVKSMAKALYGRIAAYESGLSGDDEALKSALVRNLFRAGAVPAAQISALCAYVRQEAASLAAQPVAALRAGRVSFGKPVPQASKKNPR